MAWDFETAPEFQEELDWVDDLVRTEIEPLDFILEHPYDMHTHGELLAEKQMVRDMAAEL